MTKKIELIKSSDFNPDTLRDNIQKLFWQTGKSQKQVAEEISKTLGEDEKLSQQTFANYLNGKTIPDCKMLYKIADYFGVSCDTLIGCPRTKLSHKEKILMASEITGLDIKSIDFLYQFSNENKRKILEDIKKKCIEDYIKKEKISNVEAEKKATKSMERTVLLDCPPRVIDTIIKYCDDDDFAKFSLFNLLDDFFHKDISGFMFYDDDGRDYLREETIVSCKGGLYGFVIDRGSAKQYLLMEIEKHLSNIREANIEEAKDGI